MIDQASAESLELFREALLSALDTDPLAKLNQVLQSADADVDAIKSKAVSDEQSRAHQKYSAFVIEVQNQLLRSRKSPDRFADANLRAVSRYAELHTLLDITSVECRSPAMKLYFKFQQWQRKADKP